MRLKLIPKDDVIIRKPVQSKLVTNGHADNDELRRFALMTIEDRIRFCQQYKKGEEEIGKCVCESVNRYIRLSRESRTRNVTKAQIRAVEKMLKKMKKEGKIKCQDMVQ